MEHNVLRRGAAARCRLSFGRFFTLGLLALLLGASPTWFVCQGSELPEVLWESQLLPASSNGVQRVEVWHPGRARAQALRTETGLQATKLRFRFGYETEVDETYLLTRCFTLWSNGLPQTTVSTSKLLSGDGTTRWETNEIAPTLESGEVVFRLGDEVLARSAAKDAALGLAQIRLTPYGSACRSCSASAAAAPGQPGAQLGNSWFARAAESRSTGSVLLRFGLGQTGRGQPVGELYFSASAPTPAMWKPDGLKLLALPDQVTVVREPTSGVLRQVRSPQCLADIVTLAPERYQIAFYALGASLPKFSADTLIPTKELTPFMTWTIENPDGPGGTSRLRVMEAAGTSRITNSFSWNDPAGRWELLAGNGLQKQVLSVAWDNTHTVRTETLQTLQPENNQVVFQAATKYQVFPWGEGVVEETVGTGSAARRTTYSYHQGKADQAPPAALGRLQQVIRPDGSWERYEYDEKGRLSKKYLPQVNTRPEDYRQGRVVSYEYSPWSAFGDNGSVFPLQPRTITESVGTGLVAKSYFIATPDCTIHLQCAAPSREPFDSPALGTTNRYYSLAAVRGNEAVPAPGRLKSVEYPNGTLELHRYAAGPDTFTNLVLAGQPNAAHTDIVDGTKKVTVLGDAGQPLLRETYDLAPDRSPLLTHRESFAYTDDLNRSHSVSFLDGTSNVVQYACCGVESVRDRDGLVTLYGYDDLKRLQSISRLVDGTQALVMQRRYDAANHLLATVRSGTNQTDPLTLSGAVYDTSGRLRYETNALGGVTTFAYGFDQEGHAITTHTLPNGGTRIEAYNRDGSLYQVTGTAAHGVRHEYQIAHDGARLAKEIKLTRSGEPTTEWVTEYTDLLGRPFKSEYPDGATHELFYNNLGQLCKERDPDGVTTLYGYTRRGERSMTAVVMEGRAPALRGSAKAAAGVEGEALDFSGTDRITQKARDVLFNPALGIVVQRTRTFVWANFQSCASNLVETLESSVDGLKTWHTVWHDGMGTTNRSEVRYTADGYRLEFEFAPDNSSTCKRYRLGRLEAVQQRDALDRVFAETSYGYDPHSRIAQVTDPENHTTLYAYNAADQVIAVTRPAAPPGQTPLVTLTQYNQMLQPTNVVLPDKRCVAREYFLSGELKRIAGAQAYPAEYTCDYAGRVTSMRTWKHVSAPETAAVTTWQYHPLRGWLAGKRDADGHGPDYTYTPTGRLQRRVWARETAPGSGLRVTTTYRYNGAGDLASITYNDGLTPNVAYSYDRRGRVVGVSQPATALAYNSAGQLLSESHPAGLLAGFSLTNGYDAFLRRTNFALRDGQSTVSTVSYAYDAASRLQSVRHDDCSVVYSYSPRSLPSELTFKHGEASRLFVSRQYTPEGRLFSLGAATAGKAVFSQEVEYDEAERPVRVTAADCSYWLYGYDSLGQLRQARRFQSDGKPMVGQQLKYEFDDAGHREAAGSEANPPTLYPQAPAANAEPLNQLSSESLRYDADGNLTNDGHWTLVWDAENRLVRLEAHPTDRPRQRLDFTYDWRGRRIQKEVSVWNPATQGFEVSDRTKYVYDNWNLVAECNAGQAVLGSPRRGEDTAPYPGAVRTYVWDPSWNSAAAAHSPGLLMTCKLSPIKASLPTSFACSEANASLALLVDAASESTHAQYDYGPFGEALQTFGAQARENPFRFGGQYHDDETGLVYFGQRYYSPRLGRWLNHDPLSDHAFRLASGEWLDELALTESRSLFEPGEDVFLKNRPGGQTDVLGLASSCDQQVSKALSSRRNRKLLERMAGDGCARPRIAGADTGTYCSLPGFLGDYTCANQEGLICCFNFSRPAELEQTVHHELIHAVDCCEQRLQTCEDRICSEIVAYYEADCAWFANPRECALGQMRSSLAVDETCAAAVAAANDQTVRQCLKQWKERLRRR